MRISRSSLPIVLGVCAVLMAAMPAAAAPAEDNPGDKAKKTLPVSAAPLAMMGKVDSVRTDYEDTLVHLARQYGIGFVEMRAANPDVDPWLPGSGTRVIIPAQHLIPNVARKGVVINLSEMRMYVFSKEHAEPLTFPIGIGRTGLTTPLGTTTVTRKMADPTWTPTPRMLSEDPELKPFYPPGPDNPMGTHAFYLGWPSYAIHGTNKPYSIGRRLSSGCIRMYPEDIITLNNFVNVGTSVTVIDQPVKTAWVGDDFYIEVHPTQEQSDILSHDGGKPSFELSEKELATILKNAGKEKDHIDWALVKKAIKARSGIPVKVGSRTGAAIASQEQDAKIDGDTKAKPVSAEKRPVARKDDR